MKQLKLKLTLLLFIIVMAAGAFAFRSAPRVYQTQNWYDFTGTDPNNEMDYTLHSGGIPDCPGGSNRCAVKAIQDTGVPGNKPNLSDPNILIRTKL